MVKSKNTAVIESAPEIEQFEVEIHQRPTRPPVRFGIDEYFDTVSCTTNEQCHHTAYTVNQSISIQEAMSSNHAAKWKKKQLIKSTYTCH